MELHFHSPYVFMTWCLVKLSSLSHISLAGIISCPPTLTLAPLTWPSSTCFLLTPCLYCHALREKVRVFRNALWSPHPVWVSTRLAFMAPKKISA